MANKFLTKISIVFMVLKIRPLAEFFSEKSAEKGGAEEQLDYACILIESKNDIKQKKAISIFKALVGDKKLNGLAEANLSYAYHEGLGVEKSTDESIKWEKASLLQGFDKSVAQAHNKSEVIDTEISAKSFGETYFLALACTIPLSLIIGGSGLNYLICFATFWLFLYLSWFFLKNLKSKVNLFLSYSINLVFLLGVIFLIFF